MRNLQVPVRAAKSVGLYTAGGIVFTISPIHTDEYFARKTRELIALGVDAVYLKDASGFADAGTHRDADSGIKGSLRRFAASTPFALSYGACSLLRDQGHRTWR